MRNDAFCLAVLCASVAHGADQLTISPAATTLRPGESVTFTVKCRGEVRADAKLAAAPAGIGSIRQMTYTAPNPMPDGIAAAEITLGATGGECLPSTATITLLREPGGWEARAVMGYHQAGASSTDFTQNVFFDFFVTRALSGHADRWDSRWNLWGCVRVASAPRQVSTSIAEFAAGFTQTLSQVKVNEMAQSADFQTGIEYNLHTFRAGAARRTLGLVAWAGGAGTFQAPARSVSVFAVPARDSAQYSLFASRYPTVAGFPYVGFAPPDRERFYRSYGMGVRYMSFDSGAPYAPPSVYTVTLGQDEQVTGGTFRSIVWKADVFYPLPIGRQNGKWKFLFLFGTANLRLSRAGNPTPIFLKAATENDSTPIPAFDPRVAIVTVPSNRDTYRIGVGIDFVSLLASWLAPHN
ncbi:MAG TPA: hypothetical protein VJN43_00135 [Bryobacteraceae bacterium]|nr:hypothetical protein [Bryobacteraceae bacterium]